MTETAIVLYTVLGITIAAAVLAIRFALQATRSARRVREIRRGR